jgi:hypothetical protein
MFFNKLVERKAKYTVHERDVQNWVLLVLVSL